MYENTISHDLVRPFYGPSEYFDKDKLACVKFKDSNESIKYMPVLGMNIVFSKFNYFFTLNQFDGNFDFYLFDNKILDKNGKTITTMPKYLLIKNMSDSFDNLRTISENRIKNIKQYKISYLPFSYMVELSVTAPIYLDLVFDDIFYTYLKDNERHLVKLHYNEKIISVYKIKKIQSIESLIKTIKYSYYSVKENKKIEFDIQVWPFSALYFDYNTPRSALSIKIGFTMKNPYEGSLVGIVNFNNFLRNQLHCMPSN